MKIDIILCAPQHPGNIGFCARAMKTMGFRKLVIVTEKPLDIPAALITAVDAGPLIKKSRIVDRMERLLDDYHLLVAFTARTRRFRNHISLPTLPSILAEQKPNAKIGLVFGRENSGLTNDEIKMCQAVVVIPTSRGFHSLNLSHAVQIACYEILRSQSGKRKTPQEALPQNPASAQERETIFTKLMAIMDCIGFQAQERDKLLKNFRIIFEERPLEKREAGAMHRFLDQVWHYKKDQPKIKLS